MTRGHVRMNELHVFTSWIRSLHLMPPPPPPPPPPVESDSVEDALVPKPPGGDCTPLMSIDISEVRVSGSHLPRNAQRHTRH